MSLMSMRRKMASKKTATIILWALIAVFVAGVFLAAGNPFSTKQDIQQQFASPLKGGKVIASINGEEITSREFENEFQRTLQDSGGLLDLESVLGTRQTIFVKLVNDMLDAQIEQQLDIKFNDHNIRRVAESIAKLQLHAIGMMAEEQAKQEKEQAKTDEEKKKLKTAEQLRVEQLAKFMNEQSGKDEKSGVKNPTDEEFLRWAVDLLTGKEKEQFAQSARMMLMGEAVAKSLPVDPLTDEYLSKVNTHEVLSQWMFVGAKKPSPEALEEAQKTATEARTLIVEGKSSFSDQAKKLSDDMTSKAAGGNLGWVSAGKAGYVPLMAEYLAFTTPKGEVSPLMQAQVFGMTGPQLGYGFVKARDMRERKDAPKDFKERKDYYILSTRQRYMAGLGEYFLQMMRANADIVCIMPEIQAYRAEALGDSEAATAAYQAAYKDGKVADIVRIAIGYKIASTMEKAADRIPLLQDALKYPGRHLAKYHYELAQAYGELGDTAKALENYTSAEDAAMTEGDREMVKRVLDAYKAAGNTEGIARVKQWLTDNPE
jgi:parvulin-like peptidyl-prolyl isomerase